MGDTVFPGLGLSKSLIRAKEKAKALEIPSAFLFARPEKFYR